MPPSLKSIQEIDCYCREQAGDDREEQDSRASALPVLVIVGIWLQALNIVRLHRLSSGDPSPPRPTRGDSRTW